MKIQTFIRIQHIIRSSYFVLITNLFRRDIREILAKKFNFSFNLNEISSIDEFEKRVCEIIELKSKNR